MTLLFSKEALAWYDLQGSSGIRVGMSTGLIGVQVKAAEVEVDGLAEPLTASKARGLFLEPLDA